MVGKRGVFAEFISLQTVVCIEIAERVGIQIKTWRSGMGAYPLGVLPGSFGSVYGVTGESVGGGVGL